MKENKVNRSYERLFDYLIIKLKQNIFKNFNIKEK